MRILIRAVALAAALATSALAARWSYSPAVTVSVGTSATVVVPAGFTFAYVCNQDTSKTLFWSWNDVALTTSTGTPLLAGQCLQFVNIGSDQVLRGVTTAGTLDTRVTKGFGG